MAYFEQEPKQEPRRHRRVFHEPVVSHLQDALDEADEQGIDDELLYEDTTGEFLSADDYAMTEEEEALARRDRWQVLAGIGDFLAVIAGTAVILLLIALLVSLINWVHADITQSFTLWQTKL